MVDGGTLERWRHDIVAFARDLLTHPDGRSYGGNLDPWQVEDFRLLTDHPGSCWWDRPRSHSKTTDSAVVSLHHLLITPGARVPACAADRDQAALLYDSLRGFVRRSPLLAGTFRVGKWELVAPSTDAQLVVMASDAPSSWGLRPSFVPVDELQAWRTSDHEEFFHSLYSALGKVPGARMLVTTTAGWDRESLCWRLRELAQGDPGWAYSWRGQCASWVSPVFLEEQRRILPEAVYAQVHLNQWQEEGPGALFMAADWDGCKDASLKPLQPGDRTPVVLGVDAGIRHDSFGVLGVSRDALNPTEGVAVRFVKSWQPPRGGDIQFTGPDSPDEYVRGLCRDYRVVQIAIDEYQMAALAQAWVRDGVGWVESFGQGPERLKADSRLFSLVKRRLMRHDGNEALRAHILHAGYRAAGVDTDHAIRIVKQRANRQVDLAVCLSMAADRALYLNL